jgi:type I restriction enzyme S subunit
MPRYRPYPKYSMDSVPEAWQKKRMRFTLQMNPNKSEISLADADLVSFVPMDAVGEYGDIRLSEVKELCEIGSGYTYFCDDDVVVAKITPCFENGKGALAKGLVNRTAFGTTELHVLRAHKGILDPSFLFYITTSELFRKLGASEMYGAGGQKRVPESFLKDFRVGFPLLEEQQTIVRFLDYKTAQIDALIAKKQTLLTKLAEKRTALISHAVTKGLDPSVPMKNSGVEWLGAIPTHWDVKRLKFVVSIFGGGTPNTSKPEYWNGEMPWVSPKDMKSDFIESTEDYLTTLGVQESATKVVPTDAVLIVVRSGILKHTIPVARNRVEVTLNQDMKAIVANSRLRSGFLHWLISGLQNGLLPMWSKQGCTVESIEMGYMTNTPIPLPPPDEQDEIVDHVLKVIDKIDHQASKVRAVKRFAVIVDEAHSSQSGETAMELRKILNKDGIESAIAEQLLDMDDDSLSEEAKKELLREQLKRAKQPNLSFFAFTATPKFKTLAVFNEPGQDGKAPFHHYSMRQAIEEGFIHDVLANYTGYKRYYKLIQKVEQDPEVPRRKAARALARFVEFHDYEIAQKVEVIVEHFRTHTLIIFRALLMKNRKRQVG